MLISSTLLFFLSLGIFATIVFGCVLVFLFPSVFLKVFSREECGTIVTEDHQKEMRSTLAAVNLDSRQTANTTDYDFGIYFNVVASNMTIQGGWVPYVPIPCPCLFYHYKITVSQLVLTDKIK